MNPLDAHISELLFDHDCVIVPSLGGFLASPEGARIQAAQQSIYPPSRKIAFNIYLKQNDGLLANHLVEYEQISYSEALARIDLYVKTCFSNLEDGKKVIVERVGILSYDRERNIQFEPFRQVNYLKDSFGMSAVHFAPIDRSESVPKTTKPTGEIRPSVRKEKVIRPATRRKAQRGLGLLAIAGALAWFSFNIYLVAPQRTSITTSLNPFVKETTFKALPDSMLHPRTLSVVPPAPEKTRVETVYVASTSPVLQSPVATPDVNRLPVSPADRYFVVAGVFRIPENAQEFVSSLQRKGFSDAHIEDNGKLFYVCYKGFSSRTEASALMDSLSDQHLSGWVWHN